MGFSHGYGQVPPEAYAIEAIRKAYDYGCTHFDTAEAYGKEQFYAGHNEELVGKAIEPFRKEVVLATKFHIGELPQPDETSLYREMRRHLEDSMSRLRTDYIDLYYLHRINETVRLEDVATVMGRLVKEGLIRGWGLSQVSANQIRTAHEITPLSAVQNIYSMVERDCETEIFPVCLEKGIGVVPFSPIASGFLSGKVTAQEQFGFDDPQADAIVKLQLGRLAGLEILKIEEELAGLHVKIENWEAILADDARVLAIVKEELLDMKKRFGDERRTEIQSVTGEVDIEDLIAEEQCVYTLTEAGYIKRQLKATYQAQRRGGRGISGMTRKEEDIVQEMFVGSTHDYVLFVTDKGRLFRIKGYTIAEGSRTSKGSNIVNLLQLAEGEKVTNMLCYPKDEDNKGGFVTMVTKQGLIKRTPLEQYANIRKTGLIGIALNEGDALAWTRLTTGNDMLIVATRNGQAIRFNEADARPMGRSGHGVRAIKLAEGDEVVGVCICREGGTVLTVTENGKGRRSDIDTYRITARGGKGIRNYDVTKDKVAAVKIVDDVDDVLLSSQEGIIIRLHANEIPLQSRYGSGVRVMRLGENDKVMVLARTDHDDEAQTEQIDASEADAELTAEQLAEMEAADAAAATETPEADPEEKE